jgi:hypothetical protein
VPKTGKNVFRSYNISILTYGAGTSRWTGANASTIIPVQMKISTKYRRKNQERQNNTLKIKQN